MCKVFFSIFIILCYNFLIMITRRKNAVLLFAFLLTSVQFAIIPSAVAQSSTLSPVTLTRTLTIGSRGDDVRFLQERLKTDGFFAGDVTGYFGHITQVAVIAFQRLRNLEPVGWVGSRTRRILNSEGIAVSSVTLTRTLTIGSRGDDVRFLQERLKTDGFFAGDVTGYFGHITQVAVIAFQRLRNLEPVGWVGSRTRRILNSEGIAVSSNSTSDNSGNAGAGNTSGGGVSSSAGRRSFFGGGVGSGGSGGSNKHASCTLNGLTLADGDSQLFYSTSTVARPTVCNSISQNRTCHDGTLTGSDAYNKGICSAISAPPPNPSSVFSFTLESDATTSAGVFANGALIKTLWSNVHYSSGSHTATWDGTLDDGAIAPTGSYAIKVLSNNVKYTWEGVIGNTSDSYTGPNIHHSEDIMYGMAISGSNIYYAAGYNEGRATTFKVSVSNPQSKTTVFQLPFPTAAGGVWHFVTTDGNYVYWAGYDAAIPTHQFVMATSVADDKEVKFSSGAPGALHWHGASIGTYVTTYTYDSVINQIDSASSTITGLAVQKTGNYLFVSHEYLNKIDVLSKTSGALIRSVSITSPRSLAVDRNDNLWVSYTSGGNSIVQKYSIVKDGSLSPVAGLRILELKNPLALAVSPDDKTLLVADGGTSQQLKAFDNMTAKQTWVYGREGGYSLDPTVTNDKFYFYNLLATGIGWTYLAFQTDGSFWVGDPGNYRSQHFAADRAFIDRIMWIPGLAGRTALVDANNPTRVFADFLEFSIDYSKPLGPNNGSWTLVKNWSSSNNIPTDNRSPIGRVQPYTNVATLSNGRTYATFYNFSTLKYDVAELPPTSGLRFTGVQTTQPARSSALYSDGSIGNVGNVLIGTARAAQWTKQYLTGFDSANNPQWGPPKVVATAPPTTDFSPYVSRGGLPWWEMTTSGTIVSIDDLPLTANNFGYPANTGWHLAGFDATSGAWRWKTAPSTSKNYLGDWPTDGTFDIGNRVGGAGDLVHVVGNNIFWHYYGESWKGGEVNKWTHVYDDGLMVGQFGAIQPSNAVLGADIEGRAGMAGNAFISGVVRGPDGAIYVYHSDESYHGGMHRWRVDNLDTIKEQSIPVNWEASTYKVPAIDQTDLLAGLPYGSDVLDGTAGWHRPVTGSTTVITNVRSYKKDVSPDIELRFIGKDKTATITRDLGATNASSTTWAITATMSISAPALEPYTDVYVDILDDMGKVISRIHNNRIKGIGYLYANDKTIFSSPTADFQSVISASQPLTMTASDGNLTFTYGSYPSVTAHVFDSTSDWRRPKILRVNFSSTIAAYNYNINFKELHFSFHI